MGQSSSTAVPAAVHPTPEELAAQEERIKRVMQDAYMKGMEDANVVATQRLAEMQSQFIIGSTIAAILSGGLTAAYFRSKVTQTAHEFHSVKEAANAVTLAKENEIILEKARVSELSAVCESQKNMLDSQRELLAKTNQQYNMAVARGRTLKAKYTKLLAKYGPLSVEVRNLREANGVLNQKFMMATVGAISLGMLAGALIIMNHHSGGEHVSVPVSVEVEVPAAGESTPTTTTPTGVNNNHHHNNNFSSSQNNNDRYHPNYNQGNQHYSHNNNNNNNSVVRHDKSTNIPTPQHLSPHVRVSHGAPHDAGFDNNNTNNNNNDNYNYGYSSGSDSDRGAWRSHNDDVDTLPSNAPVQHEQSTNES